MTNRVKSLAEVDKNAPNKGVGLQEPIVTLPKKMNKSTGSTAGWSESELVFYVRGWYSRKKSDA